MSTADISTLQVKVSSNGITQTANKLDALATSADKAEQAVKRLATQVITSNTNMANSASGTVALTNAILQLNNTMSSMTVRTVASTDAVRGNSAAMRDAHDAARGLAGSLDVLWVTYGNMLPMAAGLAMGTAIKGIISSGSDIENQIESLRVKGNESVETAGALRDAVLSVGKGVYGPQQVAEALDALVMAGLSGKDAINALGASLNLATAGGGSVSKAAESLVTIGTAVGATSKQYDYLADGIATAANASLASVDSIAEAMKRGSVVNKLYGATFEDILVQTAALSQLGIKNSAAGTAITNFYGDTEGKTEKAKAALKQLGMSFYDAAGYAKPFVATLEEMQAHLDKFTAKDQKQIIMDIFGERGMRDVVGSLAMVTTSSDTAKNKLEELEQQIKGMAGTSALASAQLSLTTENQMKSVGNTLQTSFATAFKDIEPEINTITSRLKAVFGSQEFINGIGNLAAAAGKLAVVLVENAGAIEAVVEGLLVYKTITTGGAIFSAMIPVVQGLAATFGAVAVGATGAAEATGLFGLAIRLLPGVGLVLGAISAVMALVALHGSEMKNQAIDTANAYNTNYLDALSKEAERLTATNKLMLEGADAATANAQATRDLALAKAQATNQDAIDQALVARNAARDAVKSAPASVPGMPSYAANAMNSQHLAAVGKLNDAQAALDGAIEASSAFNTRANDLVKQIVNGSETQRQLYKAEQERDKAAHVLGAGTQTLPEAVDKDQQKRISFYENERLALERLIATYEARTAAVLAGAASEHRVMATVEQDRVKANGVAKYPSQKAYSDEMALAAKADQDKFAQQNANATVEQENKITEVLNREAVYKKSLNDADKDRMGTLEKQTAAVLDFNSASQAEIATQRLRAAEADKILALEAARQKLQTSTASGNSRARGYIEEADAIAKYGDTARQTAVQAANLEIAKLKLNEANAGGQIQARLDAAAMEDLGKSYVELAKQAMDLQAKEDINAAVGVAGVIGSESAKVEAMRKTTQMALDFDVQRAASALVVAKASKDPAVVASAQKTFDDLTKMADKTKKLLDKNFTINIKVANLKDIGNTFSQLGKAATAMGESFAHVGTALDGVGAAFNSLAEAQAAQGISEDERQTRQIGAYGDMAQASASFFQENSKGYNIMMGVSKAFHAVEMAQSAIRLGRMAIEAVMNQAGGDPYTAFARMAAMAAIVGALGYAVSGGFSSNTASGSAEEVQKSQGTGSVLGDSAAKSDSIGKSLSTLKENANAMLPLTEGMYNSLQAIQDSMSGLASMVAQSAGLQDGSNMNITTGTTSSGAQGLIGGVVNSISSIANKIPLAGGLISGVISKLASLWGSTKQEITDSGLSYGGTVGSLAAGNGFNQYANVQTTDSSWFGLKKNTSSAVQTQGVSSDISSQFGLVFSNLESSLKIAATAIGENGDAVGKAVDSFVIDTTKVSLKGLTGDALTSAINNVISKSMDDISKAAFPQMTGFEKVGEGYAETVMRVATGVDQATSALDQLGIKAINYTQVANKQGDVAMEIAKQSIESVEGLNGIDAMLQGMSGTMDDLITQYKALDAIRSSMNGVGLNGDGLDVNMVKGAGGVSQLSTALSKYQDAYFTDGEKSAIMLKSVTAEFSKLGVALPVSKQALRDLIEKTSKDTSDSGKLLTGELLSLADAYDQATTAATTARQDQIDGINDTISSLKDFSDSIKSFRDNLTLGDLSKLTPEEKFFEAQSQYQDTLSKAQGGDTTAQGKITDAAQAYLEASRTIYASSDQYSQTFDKVESDMADLQAKTDGQLTQAEQQLGLLQKQADSLVTLNDTANNISDSLDAIVAAQPIPTSSVTVDTSALEAQIADLTTQLANAQASNDQKLDTLAAVVYNSQSDGADKIADAVTTTSRAADWIATARQTLTTTR